MGWSGPTCRPGSRHRQRDRGRPNGPLPGSLGAIFGAFKSGTTIRMNRLRGIPGQRYWQQGFHDWRIRPTHAGQFERSASSIPTNSARWWVLRRTVG